ncbi:hypothetical protein SDC9_142000 [bioreactor metagenome]|uniref:Uncharacterized protein n=1 Tax=bioreactor metagenome TaxID=1076179 RepID=A0A645DZX4_9ZZZZ
MSTNIGPFIALLFVHPQPFTHINGRLHHHFYDSQCQYRILIPVGSFMNSIVVNHITSVFPGKVTFPECGYAFHKRINFFRKSGVPRVVKLHGQIHCGIGGIAFLSPEHPFIFYRFTLDPIFEIFFHKR